VIIWIEKSLSAAQTGSFSLFCAKKKPQSNALRLFLYNQKQRAALSAGMADVASGAPKPAANREVAGSTALQKAIR